VRWLGQKAAELLAAYKRLTPRHSLRTFADVENLWDTVVRPRLPQFQTMQYHWEDREAVPEGSRWFPNSHVPTKAEDVP
jgi:creatinine amidohydrolase